MHAILYHFGLEGNLHCTHEEEETTMETPDVNDTLVKGVNGLPFLFEMKGVSGPPFFLE